MVDLWIEFVKAVWILIPAYAANGFPPLSRGKHPLDFYRNFSDHRRMFGAGKTVEGTFLGIVAGTAYGYLETLLYPTFQQAANFYGTSLPTMNIFVAFMIALGAICGDLVGSFIKRRMNLPRGKEVLLLDQLNFVIGAAVFSFAFTQISLWMFLIMILITPIIHRIVNIIGYLLKLKNEPW